MRLPAALALAFAASIATAHPGGLDQYGCHAEKPTGRYHCHEKKQLTAKPPSCRPKRAADRRIKRNHRAKRAFIETHPCPVTGSNSYRDRCPGWHVDHVIPLACCGADDPSNMAWTPAAQNLAKGARCPWDPPREAPASRHDRPFSYQ